LVESSSFILCMIYIKILNNKHDLLVSKSWEVMTFYGLSREKYIYKIKIWIF